MSSLLHVAPGTHFLCFCSSSPFVAAALFNVLIEPAPHLFKLGSTASIAAHQREFYVSWRGTNSVLGGVCRQRWFLLGQRFARAVQHVVLHFLEAAYHHSIGATNMCHMQQGRSLAVVPLRALREPGGALVHR